MLNLFQNGEQKLCMHCSKALTLQDAITVFVEEVKIRLPHFCLECKYKIPYIHRIKCYRCSAYKACYNDCKKHIVLKQNFSSIAYTDEVKEWLRAFKFEGNIDIGHALKPLFSLPIARLRDKLNSRSTSKLPYIKGLFSYRENDNCCNIVTSVPISQQRLIERGFNQAAFFGKEVATKLNAPYLTLLKRENGFEHISHLSKVEREQVVQSLYSCNQNKLYQLNKWLALQEKKEVNIIIVDDIYTTGHTLRACAKALVQHINIPCHIYSMTLARA